MSDKKKEQLEQALAEARAVIEFYGDTELWCESTKYIHDCISDCDYEKFPTPIGEAVHTVGGKRAREWLKGWGG